MANKYVSYDNLVEYHGLLKAKIDSDVTNFSNSAKGYTDTEIAKLVDSAPETLDTLGKLAVALHENDEVTDVLNAAISDKANASDLTSHTSNISNPHNVTMAQLGLSTETWTFTLSDGSTVKKSVVIK